MKADKAQTNTFPFSFGNACSSGYALMLLDDGAGNMLLEVLCGGVAANVTDSDFVVPVGQWVHVGLVKEGTTFSIYVDGKLSTSGTSTHNAPGGEFMIGATQGCNPPGISGFFTGSIDAFLYAPYAMTAADAMNARTGKYE